MGELLSAVSLLLALIGVVYGVWYPYISETLELPVPQHLTDAEPERKRVNQVLSTRARPLAYSSIALGAILLPEVVMLLATSVSTIWTYGPRAWRFYDPVGACLVLVTVLALLFSAHLLREVGKLKELRARLSEKDST